MRKQTTRILNKSAQVTLFIIIGLVILITAFAIFKIASKTKAGYIAEQEISKEGVFLPVQEKITSCLESTAEKGVYILGQHGGYIYTENFKKDILQPYNSEGVFLGDDIKRGFVPYWFYFSGSISDSESFSLKLDIPTIESIEYELSKYVSNEFENCIRNFTKLKKKKRIKIYKKTIYFFPILLKVLKI